MKYEIRVQPAQYEVIAYEYDDTQELTYEAIERGIDDYRRIKGMLKPGPGLPQKEFETFMQRQTQGLTNPLEQHERMNPVQKSFVQVIKKVMRRVPLTE